MAIINGTDMGEPLDDTAGDDTVTALGGNDTITVTSGIDTVDGGDGDDRLVVDYDSLAVAVQNVGENAFDTDSMGGGSPSVTFESVESIDISTGAGSDTIRTFFREDVNDDDNATVLSGNDRISLGAGDDRAAGGNGDDTLLGGTGDDILDGDGSLSGKFGGGNLSNIEFIGDDMLFGEEGNDLLYGGNGDDILDGGVGDDQLFGDRIVFRANDASTAGGQSVQIQENVGSDALSGNDTLIGGEGDDLLVGNAGDDTISGGTGNDTARVTVTSDGADDIDLGEGDDTVEIMANASADVSSRVRVTFTSAEVGNGNPLDSNTMANQDGGLAVRLQSEDNAGALVGPIGRHDDEGITFVASNTSAPQVTFDVRDLVSGAARGDQFEVVTLGTSAGETLTARFAGRATYINAGMGDDIVRGSTGNDFLVGGAGNDFLAGGAGRDGFLGGGGNDTINSVDAPDSIFAGVIAPEADTVDAGAGDDQVTGGRLDTLIGGDGNDFLALNFDFDGSNLDPAAVALTLNAAGTGTASDGTSISGFELVDLNLTDFDDVVNTGDVSATLSGNGGSDTLTTGAADDRVFGGAGDDVISTGGGNDTIAGGSGSDTIDGGAGDDRLSVDPSVDGSDTVNLGTGSDTVSFEGFAAGEIRVTFTSAEVGNGNAFDGNNNASEDGGLAVRVQREDENGHLIGDVSRYDDEGITFLEGTQGYTFDVRDLPSGAQRGNTFTGVVLGTSGDDDLTFFPPFRADQPFYYNAGMGNDTVTAGNGNDFLVGGAGNDTLDGGAGNDTFIGGGGNDTITGGIGFDTAIFNVTTDGADQVDLGSQSDRVQVGASAPGQIRLTFTSAEVGNGNALDGGVLANQDGGLAVRLQAEGAADALTGGISRFDDEGITFASTTAGVTFDVRDLVSGAQRGGLFEVVTLGTSASDTLTAIQPARSTYINAGAGNDVVTGGDANDFLVGGAGNDALTGGLGNDTFIGGGGNDTINGGTGFDTSIFNVTTDGADQVNLGSESDRVQVGASAPGQIRLTFTSAEVGNGNAFDAGTMAGQDGGLAVRLQAEGAGDALTGGISRFDDEGITFASTTAGLTFDVRDLVSGAARGDQFEIVTLGTSASDTLNAIQPARSTYINAGAGNDVIAGGTANDFLVGGAGNDRVDGGLGNDSFIGGGGSDVFAFSSALNGTTNVDTIIDFNVPADTISLDDAVFAALSNGALGADAFFTGTQAFDAEDRIIYNSTTGALFYDEDGVDGAAQIQFATLTANPALTADDFLVV